MISLLSISVFGCKNAAVEQENNNAVSTVTPVTITTPDTTTLKEEITLNAVSAYLLKTDIKANINGYITQSTIQAGSKIHRGQTIFVLETKEARSLGNTINQLDPSFKFSGINRIKSPVEGYVTMLNHQSGDYVQDGETLAGIAAKNSFGFVLNLPYEYHQLLNSNRKITIELPDGTLLNGYAAQVMPSVDSIAQTQRIWIKTPDAKNIPENLIAKVQLVKKASTHLSLLKAAIFSDENQQNFWVMKLSNDSTAIKVPVQKGLENDSLVEIISPAFSVTDSFVLQGGYGLGDTAKIAVQK